MGSPSWSSRLSPDAKVKITGDADYRSHSVAPLLTPERGSTRSLTIQCEAIEPLIHAIIAQHALDIQSCFLNGQTLDKLVPVSGAQLLQPPLYTPWSSIVGG